MAILSSRLYSYTLCLLIAISHPREKKNRSSIRSKWRKRLSKDVCSGEDTCLHRYIHMYMFIYLHINNHSYTISSRGMITFVLHTVWYISIGFYIVNVSMYTFRAAHRILSTSFLKYSLWVNMFVSAFILHVCTFACSQSISYFLWWVTRSRASTLHIWCVYFSFRVEGVPTMTVRERVWTFIGPSIETLDLHCIGKNEGSNSL